MAPNEPTWPALNYPAWQDTCATLQLWMQIVGKVRLALAPPVNHWWHVPLYLTARGLTTSPMPYGGGSLQIDFDFIDHRLSKLYLRTERDKALRERETPPCDVSTCKSCGAC